MEIKIKLKVRDVEIELTQEEAAELHEALRIFADAGKDKWAEFRRIVDASPKKEYVPMPYVVPYHVDPDPWRWPNWPQPYIWCSSDSNVSYSLSASTE